MVASFLSSQIEGEAPRPARHRHVLSGLFVIDAHDSNVVKRVPARLELGSVAKAQLLALTRMVTVGKRVALLPPRRSRRALLTHRAPPSGSGDGDRASDVGP